MGGGGGGGGVEREGKRKKKKRGERERARVAGEARTRAPSLVNEDGALTYWTTSP